MVDHPAAGQIEAKYRSLSPLMDERMRRQWAAAESRAFGWGGVLAVSSAIHMSPNTIRKGLAELAARDRNPGAVIESRLRKQGGGRKRCIDSDAGLLETLEWLVEPVTRGDPCSPLALDSAKAPPIWPRKLGRLGHSRQPSYGRAAAERRRLQFAEQSQDKRRHIAS